MEFLTVTKTAEISEMISMIELTYDFEKVANVPPITEVTCDYKIVEKKETKALLRVLGEIRAIQKGYMAMSFPLQEDIAKDGIMRSICNEQIDDKLDKLYRYYSKFYGIKFEDDDWGDENSEFSPQWRKEKTIENNIAEICQTLRSWEE